MTSAAIGCTADGCRGVLTSARVDGQRGARPSGAFQLTPELARRPRMKTIAALTGATQDPSPGYSPAPNAASSLFFADAAVGGSGRVRWMQITWP